MLRLPLYLPLLVLVSWAGCSGTPETYGHLTLVVDAAPGVRALTTEVLVTPPSEDAVALDARGGWPLVHSFYGRPRDRGRLSMEARDAVGDVLLSRALEVTLPSGRRAYYVFLAEECLSAPACSPNQTCGDCGVCVSIAADDQELVKVADQDDARKGAEAPRCPQSGPDPDTGSPDADGSPDVVSPGVAEAKSFVWQAPAVVATGGCVAVTIRRAPPLTVAGRAELTAQMGAFFQDAACATGTESASWSAGSAETTLYFRAPETLSPERVATALLSVGVGDQRVAQSVEVRTRAIGLSRGLQSGCVLLATGEIECFGSTMFDTLGLSSPMFPTSWADFAVPVLSARNTTPDAVMTGGAYNTCLRSADGVRCFGALDGLGVDAINPPSPQVKNLGSGVIQSSTGYASGCAVRERAGERELRCWGRNAACPSDTSSPSPPTVIVTALDEKLTTANQVEECSAGHEVMCARLQDGSVYCWGMVYDGLAQPIRSGAVALWVLDTSACAVVRSESDDDVFCWEPKGAPFIIEGLPRGRITAVAGGGDDLGQGAACAVKEGALYCWGNDLLGALGSGNDARGTQQRAVRVALPAGNIEGIAVGAAEGPTFSAIVDGLVYSWGSAHSRASGLDERHLWVPAPQLSPALDDPAIVDLSIGVETTCALLENGAVRCLGTTPGNGQTWLALGQASETLTAPQDLPAEGAAQVLVRSYPLVLMDAKHGSLVYLWGNTEWGAPNHAVELEELNDLPARPVAISAGLFDLPPRDDGLPQQNACALMEDQSVYCWGKWPEIAGAGEQTQVLPEQVFAPGSGVSAVAASCMLNDGTVECVKDRSWTRSPVPGMPAKIEALDASKNVVCGRTGTDVYCLLDGDTEAHLTFQNATSMGVGDAFACALLESGKVQCAGDNSRHQLGRTTATGSAASGDVDALSHVTKLAVGFRQACALDAGAWKCWGDNSSGHLGLVPYVYRQPRLLPAWGGPVAWD